MKTIGLIGGTTWHSSAEYYKIINNLKAKGAEGIILGCTEIPLLIKQTDFDIPIYDTTYIHASSAIDFALSQPGQARIIWTQINTDIFFHRI